MACSTCGQMRSELVQAIRRGQIGTAATIAKKGTAQIVRSIKAPPVTQAIRKR